jgi:hypothetical protein
MHLNVLTASQREILPLLERFKRSFYLVGGTAIALQIGHRRSIDFDLFSRNRLAKSRVRAAVKEFPGRQQILHEDVDQLHFLCNGVKITFLHYPFDVAHPMALGKHLTMPSLLTLAAMKAFALGRRAKWKDYVDMYFILQHHFSFTEISETAKSIFGDQYSEKLFREQLSYHEDIDYTEMVEFIGEPIPDGVIRSRLLEMATKLW